MKDAVPPSTAPPPASAQDLAARYRALEQAAASMVRIASPSGEVVESQPAWEEFTGQPLERYRGFGWLDALHPRDRERTRERWATAIHGTAPLHLEYRIRRRDGQYRWFEAHAVPVRDHAGAIRGWVGAETDVEERVARLLRSELLQDAGRLLAETVEPLALLEQVALLTIGTDERPGLADGCMVTLSPAPGVYEHVSIVSRDPGIPPLVAEMERRFPPPPDVPTGYPHVIGTCRSELVTPDDFARVLEVIAANEEHLGLLQRIQMFAGICVPIVARGRCMGAVTLVRHGPERRPPFDAADLATAEELARRVALALDNARLFREAVEAREALARAFSQLPMPIAILEGRELIFTLANPAYRRLVNRDVVGLPVQNALPEVGAEILERLHRVFELGEPFGMSEIPMRMSGSAEQEAALPRYFNFAFQPLRDGHGRVYAVAALGMEVTEQVLARQRLAESESQLRVLADAIPTLAWTARADGYIDWYNARWYEYTGTTPQHMAGWGWQSVHDPAVLPEVLERWRASIATGQPFEMTFPLRGADGRFRQFLTRVTPVRDSAGQVLRWFGTNTDVDAERAAREAAERAQVAAEEANHAKMRFLAMVSHELRTPLNAIAGYAELLALGLHGPLTEEQRGAIARIQRSQRHLLSLINDVLNFAKLDAGRVEYHIRDVRVSEVLDGLEALIGPQLQAKALQFGRAECGDLVVRADAEKLQQILVNLLSNAAKFTAAGGQVTLRCSAEGDVVRISVEDTGIGIESGRLEQIFDPFVQIHRQLHAPEEGTGLGLAISRDLARAMDGDLLVESAPGRGSTFTVVLPASRGSVRRRRGRGAGRDGGRRTRIQGDLP